MQRHKLKRRFENAYHLKDIDDAFHKVFSDYIELKLKSLQEVIERFQVKWEMSFDEFKKKLRGGI